MELLHFLEQLARVPHQQRTNFISELENPAKEIFLNQDMRQLQKTFSKKEYFADDDHVTSFD